MADIWTFEDKKYIRDRETRNRETNYRGSSNPCTNKTLRAGQQYSIGHYDELKNSTVHYINVQVLQCKSIYYRSTQNTLFLNVQFSLNLRLCEVLYTGLDIENPQKSVL